MIVFKVKKPFSDSKKTFDNSNLSSQILLADGEELNFFKEVAKVKEKTMGFIGAGKKSTVSGLIALLTSELNEGGWAPSVCEAPTNVWKRICIALASICGVVGNDSLFSEFQLGVVTTFQSARIANGEKIFSSGEYHNSKRRDFVKKRAESGVTEVVKVMALCRVSYLNSPSMDLLIYERTNEQKVQQLEFLGVPVISEIDEWDFCSLKDVVCPVTALPHGYDPSWYFIIRDKNEESLWK